jgi:hypothetical protein
MTNRPGTTRRDAEDSAVTQRDREIERLRR